jgi:hypothetical protein
MRLDLEPTNSIQREVAGARSHIYVEEHFVVVDNYEFAVICTRVWAAVGVNLNAAVLLRV